MLPHSYNKPPLKWSNISWASFQWRPSSFVQLQLLLSHYCCHVLCSKEVGDRWVTGINQSVQVWVICVFVSTSDEKCAPSRNAGGRSCREKEKWREREGERGRALDVEDENLEMIVLEQKIWSKPWQSRAHMPWESSTHDERTHQRAKLRQARNRLDTLFPSHHPVFPVLILATLHLH